MNLRLLLFKLPFLLLIVSTQAQQDSIPLAPGNLLWQRSDTAAKTSQAIFQNDQVWIVVDGEFIDSKAKRDSILNRIGQYQSKIAHIDTLDWREAQFILGPDRKGIVLALTTYQSIYTIRPWLQYRNEFSLSWIARRPDMISPNDWALLANEASLNDGLPLPYPNGLNPHPVDWQKEIFRPAYSQSHQFALFGNGKFWQERYISLSALNQGSPVASGQFNRYQSRIKLGRIQNNGHHWGFNFNGTLSQQQAYLPLLGYLEGINFHTLLAPPISFPEQSQFKFPSQGNSPAIYQPSLYAETRTQKLDQQIFSGQAYYKLIHEGNWIVNNSLSFQHWQSRQALQFPDTTSFIPLARIENSRLQSIQHRIHLAYNDDSFKNHRLNFSQSFWQEYYFWQWSTEPITGIQRSNWRSYHSTLAFEYKNNSNKLPQVSGGLEWAMSDRMRPSRQMAFFPTLSMRYRLPFWLGGAYPSIDANWSVSGNDGSALITQIAQLQQQQPFFQTENQFLTQSPDWEKKSSFNIGTRIYPVHDLSLNLIYYRNQTDNLWVALPDQNQFLVWQNLASVRNQGLELVLGYRNGNLWGEGIDIELDFNYQYNQNEILDLGDQSQLTIPLSGQLGALKVGEPLGSIWGYETDGLYQEGQSFSLEPNKQAGDIRLVDHNKDGQISELDQQIIARTLPINSIGSNIRISWKAFTLSANWYGQFGHQIVNYQRLYGRDQVNGNTHLFADAINRWTPENPDTDIPRASFQTENRITDRLVESGNFLRLKQLKLNWDLISQKPSRRDHPFYEIDLYLSAQNLWLISKYSGYDPEVYLNGAPFYLGVDRGAYPPPRSLSLGLALQW
ncbi:MAG: hypothetical protein AAFN10_21815 [Bacteroidota bacterium]